MDCILFLNITFFYWQGDKVKTDKNIYHGSKKRTDKVKNYK